MSYAAGTGPRTEPRTATANPERAAAQRARRAKIKTKVTPIRPDIEPDAEEAPERALTVEQTTFFDKIGLRPDEIDAALDVPVDWTWKASGNCRGADPDTFFPERGGSTREPKEVCRGCSVRDECLVHSLQIGERHGIWGGLSERERRRLRRYLVNLGIRISRPVPERPPLRSTEPGRTAHLTVADLFTMWGSRRAS